ncbi:MAG: helix-turn-helix transcriptional regulator [Gemmatimonadales bacterium]|nr:helix-turn-helix transcriptional regulator [Gemmatimonadales bacterium]
MTQAELVRRSGVSQRTVSRLVANETRQVHLDTLDAIATTLGVAPGELIAHNRPRQR